MKNIVILYHDDLDGFGAAWAAWKKFGDKADYLAVDHYVDHYNLAPLELKDKEIYSLDFCYPKEQTEILLKNNKKLVVIDHHITNKETIKILKYYVWDIKRSGCVLSWQYFHPGKKIPKLIGYIEDIDLWKFKNKNTRPLTMVLEGLPYNFKLWNKIAVELENKNKSLVYLKQGKAIVEFIDKAVNIIALNTEKVIFEKKKALAINSPIFACELGDFFIKKKKSPVAIIWSLRNGKIKVQLRSSKKVDVSKLAQKYGGGGHKQAAGFILEIGEKIPWRTIK